MEAAKHILVEVGKYASMVQKNVDDGSAAGVRGTPGFFVRKMRPDGTIEGVSISSACPVSVFRTEIERLLAEK